MTANAFLSGERLLELAAGVFQEAAFCFIEPLDGDVPPADELLVAGIPFTGTLRGRLQIAAPPVFASLLAANLLGLDPDEEDVAAQCEGALGELLNMVAGQLFCECLGADNDIQLGLPETQTMSGEAFWALLGAETVHVAGLAEDEQRVDFALTLIT